MINQFKSEAEKILSFLRSGYAKLQTGRANAALVENLDIEAYGQKQQLRSIAGISVEDAKTIVIQPWDTSVLQEVEKSLLKADLGVNPVNDGQRLRLVLPPMTEERREKLKKIVQELAEEARVAVRQKREQIRNKIKETQDKDEKSRYDKSLQEAVNATNKEIEEVKQKKEEEIMTI